MTNPKYPPALDNAEMEHQGKTRDMFKTTSPKETMLIVATERLSTHNIVHESRVPYKDQVLTALTIFWLIDKLDKVGIRHHLVAYGVEIYKHLPGSRSDYPDDLHLRAIVVKKLTVIPVEFIYRKYLAGSFWHKFYSKGLPNPYGVVLEPNLPLMTEFEEPIFTPTEKSATDDELEAAAVLRQYPEASALSREVFMLVGDHMRERGLDEVDGKFEVGVDSEGNVVIIDEAATPDSSRFCKKDEVKLGQEPPWLDKQIARDEAERIWGTGKKVPLTFSPEIIHKLSETYLGVFFRITGTTLQTFQRMRLENN